MELFTMITWLGLMTSVTFIVMIVMNSVVKIKKIKYENQAKYYISKKREKEKKSL